MQKKNDPFFNEPPFDTQILLLVGKLSSIGVTDEKL
jgi:hypothetical protein